MITPQSQYWYDALNRLLKATGRELSSLNAPDQNDFVNNLPIPSGSDMQNYTHHYSYDALGNIQSVQSTGGNGWTRTYNYNTVNNYLTSTQVGQDTSAYTYDKHGNIVTMPHLPQMEWDYADRMKKTLCGTVNTWYCYDIQGERVRKVTEKQGGITEERIYLNGYEIYRKYISGVLDLERQSLDILAIKINEEGEGEEKQVQYIYDHNKKIALIETKTVENGEGIVNPIPLIRYQYDNFLGSACLELDASAAIISYEEYHPFGTTSYRSGRNETEVSLKRYKYVGKERDEETGLYYYGARYYAAWLCRFVSVDALQFDYLNTSPYAFVANNPINAIDKDGRKIIFINGYHTDNWVGRNIIGSDKGGKAYWDTGFSNAAQKFFNDYSKISDANYIDGSSSWGGDMSGKDRYDAGYAYAKANIKTLTADMAVGETFKMVTHSEGAAYGAGVAQYLIEKGYKVETIVHLSADEGDEFKTPIGPKTYQFGYEGDWVTGNKKISGVDKFGLALRKDLNFMTVHGSTKSASVFSYVQDLVTVEIQQNVGLFGKQYASWNSQRQGTTSNGTLFTNIDGFILSFTNGTPIKW